MKGKILDRRELRRRLGELRSSGKRIVFTNGCFDILHVGHVRYLGEARRLGDVLVVAVNSDASVREIKGEKRPLVPEEERAELIAALECVDFVTVFSEPTPLALIRMLQPDTLVKGGDWRAENVVGRDEVLSRGGRVELIPMTEGASTTNIIEKILDVYGRGTGQSA
ncbi:MAG: Bifunctional protein HldE [Syntrophaceae bacterium PtaU1.Bin231]|nr:MAG: Bifunctional protein HldE [Syntrophaceae bacterium PtaU1.Bin231]HOG17172.1 D-glycero-beta-D-manno-heptose 1-phosphate adenylyltransferase [Syntrophales bacterium]